MHIDTKITCPICGSSEIKHKWYVSSYSVGECSQCKASFVTNPPDLEELTRYYSTVADPAYVENNREQLSYYYNKLGKLIKEMMPEGKRIFDVGCSRGWFFDSMKGWECHGNELNEHESSEAQKLYGTNILHCSFEDCPEYSEAFDVVAVQDVLDHFIDPMAVIRKANKMLRKGGMLVIKVHDYDCLYARISGAKFYAVIPPSHLTYFNRKSLKIVCEKNGFTIKKSLHVAQLIALPTIFYRLSQTNENSIFSWIYKKIRSTPFKNIVIKKNFNDIITIIAIKTKEVD